MEVSVGAVCAACFALARHRERDLARMLALVLLGALACASPVGEPSAAPDADLRIEPAAVPDGSNGFLRLAEATREVHLSKEQRERLGTLSSGAAWDASLAQELVAANDLALVHLGAALRSPAFQSPGLGDDPEPLAWVGLARLSATRALLRARSGDPHGAVADALATIRLGHLVASDPYCLLPCAVVGIVVKDLGTRALAVALPELRPTPGESRALARELALQRVDPAAWRSMWAAEYQRIKPVLSTVEDAGEAAWLAGTADQIRGIRAWAGRPCALWLAPEGPEHGLRENVLKIGFVDFGKFELRRCLSDTQNAAARTLVALRAHQLERGRLPLSLDELVPRYLDALPLDGFDGRPLRYDPEERVLRSVGSDLTLAPFSGHWSDQALADPLFPIRF
jgi:hypothetical protein